MRCNVCWVNVHRGFEEHVRMHQHAARDRQVNRHPERYPRLMERLHPSIAPVSVKGSLAFALAGAGEEVRIHQQSAKPGFWSRISSFYRYLCGYYVSWGGK